MFRVFDILVEIKDLSEDAIKSKLHFIPDDDYKNTVCRFILFHFSESHDSVVGIVYDGLEILISRSRSLQLDSSESRALGDVSSPFGLSIVRYFRRLLLHKGRGD